MKKTFPRPKLFVSRCLGFDACRYNGLKIIDRSVELLKSHADIVTACPELAIGLGVPRKPIRVVEEEGRRMLYQPATENDYAAAMEAWLGDYLDALGPVDGLSLRRRARPAAPGVSNALRADISLELRRSALGFSAVRLSIVFSAVP